MPAGTSWEDKVWSRRYEAILVTDEEAAQVDRLKYILENSCKEGLVDSPIHWPGVHCAKALITGDRVEGTWFDRKLEYNARLQGKEPGPREFASTESVVLSQLPCWRHLAPEAYRSRMAQLVQEIEETAAVERQETGKELLGERGRPGPGSGDSSEEDQEVGRAVRPRGGQGGAQSDVGGLAGSWRRSARPRKG